MARGSDQKFIFEGMYEMYDPKINRAVKSIEQTIETCRVFNLNFRPGFNFL